MATSEIHEYFHARFVQILKAPEIISIWTILVDPGAVSWVRKNGSEQKSERSWDNSQQCATKPLWLVDSQQTKNFNKSNFVIFHPYQARIAYQLKLCMFDNEKNKYVRLDYCLEANVLPITFLYYESVSTLMHDIKWSPSKHVKFISENVLY